MLLSAWVFRRGNPLRTRVECSEETPNLISTLPIRPKVHTSSFIPCRCPRGQPYFRSEMENPSPTDSKRLRLAGPDGLSCSVRIAANTPAVAIQGILNARFKGREVVGVQIDDDLVPIDLLYQSAEDGKEYSAIFAEPSRPSVKLCCP